MYLGLFQAATSATGPGGLPIIIFQFAAIGLVFYFLILRPQSQARKKHAELLSSLKRGDDVMTAGGLIGRVKDIREIKDRNESHVTLETGTSTVVVERSRIVRVGNDAAAPPAA